MHFKTNKQVANMNIQRAALLRIVPAQKSLGKHCNRKSNLPSSCWRL